jgi:hypothetical protein
VSDQQRLYIIALLKKIVKSFSILFQKNSKKFSTFFSWAKNSKKKVEKIRSYVLHFLIKYVIIKKTR